MEILIKNQKEIIEIKNTIIEMNTAFDGLISRCDTAEEGNFELEDVSLESWKTKNKENKKVESIVNKLLKLKVAGPDVFTGEFLNT